MIPNKPIYGVLTGDVVNSTSIPVFKAERLLKELAGELTPYVVSFYRGDSFQVFMEDPKKSLRTALICRTLAISMTEPGSVRSDVRVSVGIGKVQLPVRMPDMARGEAFILSGRGLDKIEGTEQRLSIGSGHEIADIGFEIMANYIDSIFNKMTSKQAVVLLDLLKGQQQQDAVLKLKRSKSTISQLVSAGRWPEVEKLLEQFETLINQLL
ncbi:MAG TPA: hypothetical protein VN824_13550 [Puia sp.]|nr:hypothetical protein [Puia sp.]